MSSLKVSLQSFCSTQFKLFYFRCDKTSINFQFSAVNKKMLSIKQLVKIFYGFLQTMIQFNSRLPF